MRVERGRSNSGSDTGICCEHRSLGSESLILDPISVCSDGEDIGIALRYSKSAV